MTPSPQMNIQAPNPPLPVQMTEEIRSKLKASISNLCATTIRPTVETDKVTWNARIRRNELYYRGLQYLSYTPGGTGGVVDYQPVQSGQPLSLTTNSQNDALYDYVLNFFQGDVDTFIAVLGSRAPNGQAQALDLSNESHVSRKMKADRVNAYLDGHWDVSGMHAQLVRGLAIYGTMFSHVRYTINPRKWGVTPVTSYSVQNIPMGSPYYQCWKCGTETPMEQAQALALQPQPGYPPPPPGVGMCSKCGTPLGPDSMVQPDSMPSLVPSETVNYYNGAATLDLLNPACVTAQVNLKDIDNLPWLIKETEEDKGSLVQAYPELREKVYSDQYYIDPSSAASAGRWTRDLLTSPSGYMVPRTKGRWLHTQAWITPACYEYLPSDRNGQLRDWLTTRFPDGFMVPMVNGELMLGKGQPGSVGYAPTRMMAERLSSVWASCKPKPSEMLYCDPYFECMIQGQDCVNDSVSMLIEQAERSNPFTIADPEILDPNMLRLYNNVPGEFKFAKAGSVGSLDKGFFRVPGAELNPVMITFIDKYIAWCREITGITPAIFGGADGGGQKTARQYEIMRNQALQKLNTVWSQCRHFWAKTRENGIYQIAKYSGGRLHSSNQQGVLQFTEIEGVWELLQGGWYMQCEESMPTTIGQRRDFFMNALTMPPEAQQIIGLQEPDNIVKLQEAIGLSDWDTPGYKQVMRLHDVIGQLKAAQPIPGMPDPMTGQPGPPKPSIPFDSFLFDPPLATKVVKGWLLSDAGEATRLSTPGGYMNVMAFGHDAQSAMGSSAPPPPPAKTSIAIDFSSLTPQAQHDVMQYEGITMTSPPGVALTIPKPVPQSAGGSSRPLLPSSNPGSPGPPNQLNTPPPGGAPPSDLAAQPQLSALSAPAPGVLQ